mmetsp:Transcript_62960/g.194913  ORF Transcript_62960/g.194913 Transcript_62960/m.194913 type:complete len:448 (+) Transcript_62960:303-1646(+)
MEDGLRFGYVDVDGLEELPHVRVVEPVLELLPGDLAVLVQVGVRKQVARGAEQDGLVVVPGGLQARLHEDSGHDIHHGQHREGDVQRERKAHERMDVPRQRLSGAQPVYAAHDGAVQRQDGHAERAVQRDEVAVCAGLGMPQPVVQDQLREAHADDVDQQHEQQERPAERLDGASDGEHDGLKLADVLQDAGCAEQPDDPENPQGPQEAEAEVVPLSDGADRDEELQELLEHLQSHHEAIKQVPMPPWHQEEGSAVDVEPGKELDEEEGAEDGLRDAVGYRNLLRHLRRQVVGLHADRDQVREDDQGREVVEVEILYHRQHEAVAPAPFRLLPGLRASRYLPGDLGHARALAPLVPLEVQLVHLRAEGVLGTAHEGIADIIDVGSVLRLGVPLPVALALGLGRVVRAGLGVAPADLGGGHDADEGAGGRRAVGALRHDLEGAEGGTA